MSRAESPLPLPGQVLHAPFLLSSRSLFLWEAAAHLVSWSVMHREQENGVPVGLRWTASLPGPAQRGGLSESSSVCPPALRPSGLKLPGGADRSRSSLVSWEAGEEGLHYRSESVEGAAGQRLIVSALWVKPGALSYRMETISFSFPNL